MFKWIANMKSENWGGVTSMAGSLISLAAGDAEGVVSTVSFVASEISFARKGHTSAGYSLGCAGISFGDGMLCFSQATAGNATLQVTMGILTGVWAIGALRYPIEQAGKVVTQYYSNDLGGALQTTADIIPSLVGSTALVCRVPALYTAAFTGEHVNVVMLACNALWGTADILLGRVQTFIKGPVRVFVQGADSLTGNRCGHYIVNPAQKAFRAVWHPKKNVKAFTRDV